MLLQERSTFTDTVWRTDRKLFPDRSREQIFSGQLSDDGHWNKHIDMIIFSGLSDWYAKNIVGPAWFLPVRSVIFRYVCKFRNIIITLYYIINSIKWKYLAATELMNNSVLFFNSSCQRPCELLPSLDVRRTSSVVR